MRSRPPIGNAEKSMMTSKRSAEPCQSSEVTVTGCGRKLPSVAITVIGTSLFWALTSANFQKRDMLPARMRKRYLRGSTSKNGL